MLGARDADDPLGSPAALVEASYEQPAAAAEQVGEGPRCGALVTHGATVANKRPARAPGREGDMSFERILVATDFSDASDAALDVAVDLARRLGSELILVHACEELGVVPGSDLAEEARQKAQQALDARLARLHAKDVRVRGAVRGGLPLDEIVAAAGAERAGLLVLGTKDGSRLAELFGSLVDSVMDRAPCPVLTIRRPAMG